MRAISRAGTFLHPLLSSGFGNIFAGDVVAHLAKTPRKWVNVVVSLLAVIDCRPTGTGI